MTLTEKTTLLVAVPIGKDKAEGWRKIWYRLDCWAPMTVRHYLQTLHAEGRVQRREVKTNSGFRWEYWREDTPAARPELTVLVAG